MTLEFEIGRNREKFMHLLEQYNRNRELRVK
jgi:hypothetical protein